MKKSVIAMCLVVFTIGIMLAPAAQATFTPGEITTTVMELGRGITVKSTVTICESISAYSTMASKTAKKTDIYERNGTEIATVIITASFGYDGTTSWVNSASVSKSVSSGWTYTNENLTTSGGTATVTALLKKTGIETVDVYTYISCSHNGDIS